MSRSGSDGFRPLGSPTDRLFALYALFAGSALAFPHRPREWILLALLHAAAFGLGMGLPPLQRAWQAAARAAPRLTALLHDVYPLLLIPPLYSELPLLNRAIHDGAYFDHLVQGWEFALFRGQPSSALAQALPLPLLSEVLHLSYLSYYLLVFVPPLALYLGRRRPAFRGAIFALMLTFVAHYLFFIVFPVQGPRYLFPAPAGPLAEGPVYRLTHAVLEAASSQGAAFPSSHVGVAVTQVVISWRYLRRWTPLIAALSAGLALGAVYGGFHYAVDTFAGALLGALCAVAGLRLHDRSSGARPAP